MSSAMYEVMLETQLEMNAQQQNFIAVVCQVNQGRKEKENMQLEILFSTGQVPSCILLPPSLTEKQVRQVGQQKIACACSYSSVVCCCRTKMCCFCPPSPFPIAWTFCGGMGCLPWVRSWGNMGLANLGEIMSMRKKCYFLFCMHYPALCSWHWSRQLQPLQVQSHSVLLAPNCRMFGMSCSYLGAGVALILF